MEFKNSCKDCDGLTYSKISPQGTILKNKFMPWSAENGGILLSRRGMATLKNNNYVLGIALGKLANHNMGEKSYIVIKVAD
jgi:hypothetical protein